MWIRELISSVFYYITIGLEFCDNTDAATTNEEPIPNVRKPTPAFQHIPVDSFDDADIAQDLKEYVDQELVVADEGIVELSMAIDNIQGVFKRTRDERDFDYDSDGCDDSKLPPTSKLLKRKSM